MIFIAVKNDFYYVCYVVCVIEIDKHELLCFFYKIIYCVCYNLKITRLHLYF